MNDQDHHEQALATAERLLGHPLVLPLAPAEPASGADFRRLATVHTFGDSWARSALDDRSRALVSVAITAALGTREPLRGQLRIALNSGISKDEIVRALAELPPGTRGRAADLTDPALVGRLFGDLACAAWKSWAEISGSWAMMSDQTKRPASFQRIRVS